MPRGLRSNRKHVLAKCTAMPKILFLVAHPVEDASCRYRVQQFVPLLERAGYACTISEFSTPQLFRALQSHGRLPTKAVHTIYCSVRRLARLADLCDFDLVVIHREVFPFLTPTLEKWVLGRHKKVLFSLDDAIYTTHPVSARLNHPLLYRLKYGGRVHEVIRNSAHVVAGNRILAEYARQFNSQVTTIPTVVDCERYPYKSISDVSKRPLTVGWMGSRSTASYLFNIAGALRRLAESHRDRVQFRFVGCEDLKLNIPNSSFVPFRLETELDDLYSLDIGLMPMPDTPWTRGKCAFKAIQYMAAGIPTVASPVGATLDVVQHNHNGLLAESEDQWFHSLDLLVSDRDARKRLSLRGRETIEKAYSLQVWGPKLVSLLDQLNDSHPLRLSQDRKIETPAIPQ